MARSEPQGTPIFGSPWFFVSILLFGAGAAFRWDVVAYGGIIVIDIFLGVGIASGRESPPKLQRLHAGFLWGAGALVTWVLMVVASGYSPAVILRTIRTAGPDDQYQNLLVTGVTIQTLVTPALFVCACTGLAVLLRRRHPLAIVFAAGLILVARVLKFGDPKFILVAVPALLACALAGFSEIWTCFSSGGKAYALRTALVLLVLAPWLLGLQTFAGDSAYGPGFDVQAFDHPLHPARFVRLAASPGALVPTLEGPRPIGGNLWVLFTGKWRQTVEKASSERTIAIDSAIARNVPLLQDNGEGYAVATLAGMGFTTQDSWKRLIGPSYVLERRFFSEDKKRYVRMLRLRNRDNLFTASGIRQLEEISGVQTVVIYAYTSTLRKLYKIAPGALQKLDTATALLDLEKLRHSLGPPS
jgi:hypothetical protein